MFFVRALSFSTACSSWVGRHASAGSGAFGRDCAGHRCSTSCGRPSSARSVTATAENGSSAAVAGDRRRDRCPRAAFALTLPPGRFVIRIAADGFRDGTQNLVTAAAGRRRCSSCSRSPAVREDVTVTAPSGYQVPAVTTATKTADAAARRAAVGHRRDQGADPGPDDDEHRRRHALRARRDACTRARTTATRSSSAATARRPTSSSTACATTCSTTATCTTWIASRRSKGPNAMIFGRGGGGGVVNRVSKEAGFAPSPRAVTPGRACSATRASRRTRSAAGRQGRVPRERDVREFRQLPRSRRPRAVRRHADGDDRAERPHDGLAALRVPERHARRRPRDHLVPGPAGRRRLATYLRQPGPQPRARPHVNVLSATIEHRAGRLHDAQSHARSATTIAAIRTSCRARSRQTSARWR